MQKKDLNINDSLTETWTEATTREVDKTYKAGTTVVFWYLFDTLELLKHATFSGQCCTATSLDTTAKVDVWVTDYEDVTPDANLQIFRGQPTKTISTTGGALQ
jgi:hypothetical protein